MKPTVRCLVCNRDFLSIGAYTHPTHSCCSRTPYTANTAVEQPTSTTAPTSPRGAVVLPFARRPQPRHSA